MEVAELQSFSKEGINIGQPASVLAHQAALSICPGARQGSVNAVC